MSIMARCGACQKLYKVDDTWVGKKVRCKGCGQVFAVASEATSPAFPSIPRTAPRPTSNRPAPARAASSRVVAKPAAPPPTAPTAPTSEDPFADFDALASLESTGTLAEPEDAPVSRRRAAVVAQGPYAPVIVEPLSYGTTPPDPFVTIPGEELIDKFLPLVPVGILVVFVIMAGYRGITHLSEQAEALHVPDEVKSQAMGRFLGFLAGLVVGILAIPAPLCLLGIFIASRIMKFTNPTGLYFKCLAVVCTPWALTFAFNGFDLDQSLHSVSYLVSVPVMIGVLWLLLRLRIAPFAVAAACAGVLCVGLPYLILTLVIGSSRPSYRTTGATPPPKVTSPATPTHTPSPSRTVVSPATGPVPNLYKADSPPSPRVLPLDPVAARKAAEEAMKKVGEALQKYASGHQGGYPSTLSECVAAGLMTYADVNAHESQFHIFYNGKSGWKSPLPAKLILAHEVGVKDGKRTVLFGDLRVETMDMATYQLAAKESSQIKSQMD